MKRISLIALILSVFAASVFSQESESANTCITCHEMLDPPLSVPSVQLKGSVHDDPKLSCVGCHGGDASEEDPELSMSPAKGFIGKPDQLKSVELCAKCHSSVTFMRDFNPNISVDQYARYLTSQHGMLLATGDHKVATCISCHGVHDIKKADDPTSMVFPTNIADVCAQCHADPNYMQGYNIETSQGEEYKSSIHAQMLYEKGDLSAPTCNDCHGNHGAIPPGITSIANVCGTCHYVQSEYFSSSPHKSAFDELGFAECEACHGNHAIIAPTSELLGTTDDASCVNCHEEDSDGYKVAGLLRTNIDTLTAKIADAEILLSKTQRAGVDIPSDERLHLSDAINALIHAKTLVHTFSVAKVQESTTKGIEAADKAIAVGKSALKEVDHRRQLLIIMVVLTLLVAGLLLLYIRDRERRKSE